MIDIFLDKVVNRIFSFEKDGFIKQYEGGYSDYKQQQEQEEITTTTNSVTTPKKQVIPAKTQRVKKMTYMEQREYETIADTVNNLEQELKNLQKQQEAVASDYVKLQEIVVQKENLEIELENAMQRWVYLNELAEEIEKSKEEHNKWKI